MSAVDFDGVEIRNRKMIETIEIARGAAASPAHMLIVGAAGTGKTALARWIHRLGRGGRNLVTLAARDFEGANVTSMFREAREGTLLIEDVELSPPALQASLVDALDASTESERPRVICTSRRELRSLVRQDLFRQDLYYRVTILTLDVPTLEQRREDLLPMARFLVEVSSILHGKRGLRLSPEAEDRILAWRWPGNLREMENVIERAVTIAAGMVIEASAILFESEERAGSNDFGPGMSLSEAERRLILQTLELTAQNRTRAAQMLGISIRTLRNKINEYREAGAL